MDGWMDGWAGGRTDGMDGWAGGRTDGRTDRDRFQSYYGNSYHQFVCRRYTELIRPVPEDAIAEVS